MTQSISANVRAEMARAGVKQTELALALNMPQAAISRRLTDETPWRASEIQAIAALLHVPITALLPDPNNVQMTA